MQQYYTAIETNGSNQFIGVVHNSSNNSVEYRTKPHFSQIQAMMEITDFLKNKKPTTNNPTTIQTNIATKAVHYQPIPQPVRRCCGR